MARTPEAPSPVAEFETHRGRLFGLAYRLLGSAAEAEDAVQDAYLRWSAADHAAIRTPAAWLTKVVTNLCLNRLTSARARRERYVGPWLPEPVRTDDGALGPLETVEQRDSVSLAVLVLLERLTPAERAVFVLREAFGYGHREIAEALDLTEANSRQLYRRATQNVADRRRFRVDQEANRRLADRFLAAARTGDLPALESMLARDVTSWADGGGKVSTARNPVTGRDKVARYLTGSFTKLPPNLEFRYTELNGQPGYLVGTVLGAVTLTIEADHITKIHIVANPDKLTYVSSQNGGPVGS